MTVMRKVTIIPALLLIAASPPPTREEIGPEPAFRDATLIAEQAIRAQLLDPDSARIEWPYAFTGGAIKPLFGKKHVGWISCGLVNAKNRMGGFTGQAWFQVVIRSGSVDMIDIGEAQEPDLVGMSCHKLVKDGFLRPAPELPVAEVVPTGTPDQFQANAQAAAAKGGLGIVFVPSPVGAVLMAVAPGSRADKAGLKAGETIEAINGISTKGMEPATIMAMLRAATSGLTLKIAGVGDVVVQ